MFRLSRTIGLQLAAVDDTLGKVEDCLFDDHQWVLRYFVADTRRWLPGRLVLISPASVNKPEPEADLLSVNLTRDQVKQSPPLEAEKPVSRAMEERVVEHYSWPAYWATTRAMRAAGPGAPAVKDTFGRPERREQPAGHEDPTLRSFEEVTNYTIEASDGKVGSVVDMLADENAWQIRYLLADTQTWLPGRKVLLSPLWISRIEWAEKRVVVNLDREAIKASPPYDDSAPVEWEYEVLLHDHYGITEATAPTRR